MHKGRRVSVVFPAFNEEENVYEAVKDFLLNSVDEVIVVDNSSADRTAELALKAGAQVYKEEQRGYGYACRRALKESSGDIIILSEPDGTFSGRDIEKLLAYIDDFEMVLGTRTTRELIHEGSNMGPFLRWGNWFLAKLIELLYNGPSLSDVGCTMRAIRRDALQRIQGEFTVGKSHFSPEMIIIALKHRIRTIEIPVNYRPRKGISKITGEKRGAFKVGLNMLYLIFTRLW